MNYYKHPTAIVESDDIGVESKIWHFVHIRDNAIIGKHCNIGKSVYIDTEVKIGNNVKIQNFVSIYKGVEIEDDVFIGPSVVFTNDLYPRAFIWDEDRVVKTIIKKGSSIGANSTVICGITIGEYSMIGAGSVVTKDVPPYSLVYGNPAKFKRYICHCGNRLNKTIEERENGNIYQCDCGKIIKIKNLMENKIKNE